jgi:hypothetical protein
VILAHRLALSIGRFQLCATFGLLQDCNSALHL